MPRLSPAPARFERRVAGVDYGVLDRLVGYALRRAQIALYEDFDAALGPLEMTPQRFSAMVVIAGNAGITQVALGRVLGVARSGVVQIVHALESRRWVVRRVDASDARVWSLALTDEGRVRLDTARRGVRAHDRRISRRLSDEERTQLIALLDRLGPAD